MAKKRCINTKFWSDSFIIDLEPLERYLFLYLLTNEHTNICGIYELPIKIIERETGIDYNRLSKTMDKLKEKVVFLDEKWIYIKNFAKHQAINPKIEIGIKRSLEEIPNEIMTKIKQKDIDYIQSIDSLSKTIIYSNSNSNSNSNINTRERVAKNAHTQQGELNFDKDKIIQFLVEKGLNEKIAKTELDKFILYWTEPNQRGKQRWQGQKFFDVRRRLITWINRSYESKSDGSKTINLDNL